MATPDPELDYLQPDFDPASATVPRLRSILVAHDVNYASASKKSQLIDLFNEHVSPQARKLLNARSRTKRSARGIKDVPSSQNSTVDEEEDEEENVVAPLLQTTARKSARRTRATPSVEPEPTELLSRRTPARSVESRQSRQSSLHVDDEKLRRRTRLSATPVFKTEDESEPETWHKNDEESPFSTDNPFQSGSSPIVPDIKIKRDSRRKTLETEDPSDKRNSRTNRRRSDFPISTRDSENPTQRRSLQPTAAQPSIPDEVQDDDDDSVEAGEEFSPDAQLELEMERAATGREVVLPTRRQKVSRASAGLKPALWSVITTVAVGLAAMWRQEKLAVGYCGIGQPSSQLAGVEIPEWADTLRPQCEPCPQHAYCSSNLDTTCEPDFILREHPLSLLGLVPLPPTCEPDGEKARKVKQVADRAVEELRERNAKFECGDLKDDQGKQLDSPAIPEAELKQTVAERKRKGMSDAEFEDLWRGAIGEILGREEVSSSTSKTTDSYSSRAIVSSSLARIPLSCAIKRSLRVTLARYFWQLISVLGLLVGGAYGKSRITSNRETEVKAKQLASYALNRLAQQANLHAHDPVAFPENWISMGQLRDDILRDEFSAARRQRLWGKVQKKVEQNSNIRPMVREGRSGEVSRVWEWIGAVGVLEDGPNSRRQSSRYSLGAVSGSSPPQLTPAKDDSARLIKPEIKNWDESRPIY